MLLALLLAWPATLRGQPVTNLLINGDFSAGTNGWTLVKARTWGSYPQFYIYTNMHCLSAQSGNPYLEMQVPVRTIAYAEQAVTLPDAPAVLSLRTWGHLNPTTTTISVIDASNGVHVLDQFVEPSLETLTNGNLDCSGAGPVAKSYFLQGFGSQTVRIRLETTALGSNGTITDFDDVSLTVLSQVYWVGSTDNWSSAAMWVPTPPSSNSYVVLPAGAVVNVDVPDAEVGALTVEAGSTLQVASGGALALYGPLLNNGKMDLSGDVNSYAPGNAVIQNGTLWIDSGVSMRGFDSGGSDFAFTQAGGDTTVNGTLDFGNGYIYVQGGSLNINQGAAMKGMDSGGSDVAFVQTGGSVTIDGTFETWNASVQDGQFTVGSSGSVAIGGIGSGGTGFTQSGGDVSINGTVGFGGVGSGGFGVDYTQSGGTLGGSGTIDGSLVADAGVIAPGDAPGTLTITSNFTQNAGSTLRLRLAGRQAGQFDQLVVGGATVLGGTLEVDLQDSYAPDLGEQFPFVVTANLSGAFSKVTVPAGITVAYNSTNGVVPVVTGIVPTQILGPVLSGTNAVLTFGTVTNRSYTVEWTSDLGTANWLSLTNLTGTGVKMQVAVPVAGQRFFRVSQP